MAKSNAVVDTVILAEQLSNLVKLTDPEGILDLPEFESDKAAKIRLKQVNQSSRSDC